MQGSDRRAKEDKNIIERACPGEMVSLSLFLHVVNDAQGLHGTNVRLDFEDTEHGGLLHHTPPHFQVCYFVQVHMAIIWTLLITPNRRRCKTSRKRSFLDFFFFRCFSRAFCFLKNNRSWQPACARQCGGRRLSMEERNQYGI